MLERMVRIRVAVEHTILECPEEKDIVIEPKQWTSAKDLVAFLSPFKTYTKLLEGNIYIMCIYVYIYSYTYAYSNTYIHTL